MCCSIGGTRRKRTSNLIFIYLFILLVALVNTRRPFEAKTWCHTPCMFVFFYPVFPFNIMFCFQNKKKKNVKHVMRQFYKINIACEKIFKENELVPYPLHVCFFHQIRTPALFKQCCYIINMWFILREKIIQTHQFCPNQSPIHAFEKSSLISYLSFFTS